MKLKKIIASLIIIFITLIMIVGLSGLNFLTPTNVQNKSQKSGDEREKILNEAMNKIFLSTKDNVRIAADLYGVENPIGYIVLVHMMPATKESWADFANKLQGLGYESISIDLRGHGESDGGPSGYLKFSDKDHQNSILDLEAAVDYFKKIGATSDKIYFVGASIGANLSLQYLADNNDFKKAVLLSAGLDYRGVKTESLAKRIRPGQSVFLVSAKDDDNNAAESEKLFEEINIVDKKIKIYDKGGHGTNILKSQPESQELIIDFIK